MRARTSAKRRQQIQLAVCWSHVRLKFYELADKSPVATEVLRCIAMLYPIEDEISGSTAEQRREVRAERSPLDQPDIGRLAVWLGRCGVPCPIAWTPAPILQG